MRRLMLRLPRTRRNQLVCLILVLCVAYSMWGPRKRHRDREFSRRERDLRLREGLMLDKGTGCQMPHLDPFSKEIMQFDKESPKIKCRGNDWVQCHNSKCKVKEEILNTTTGVKCSFVDILYDNDFSYHYSYPEVDVYGPEPYILTKSDYAKVKCTGTHVNSFISSKWIGVVVGFRTTVQPKPSPPGRGNNLNVLIIGYDTASRNGFIRKMPKSYKFLDEEMNATILKSYNIIGDGTPAALFPILTGKIDLEMKESRSGVAKYGSVDADDFIFAKLQEDGYRTAFFEDSPETGAFQYRYSGFNRQPADHYLRTFFLEEYKQEGPLRHFCVGSRPRYQIVFDVTKQFLNFGGKLCTFTFIGDISHDDFNRITVADDETVNFLKFFMKSERSKDTILFFMGDHGVRFAKVRATYQGRLEERLALMAIRVPDALLARRPEARAVLEANADVLSSPLDIFATAVDAIGRSDLRNPYKVEGADLTRGMSLLQPIPKNRSCSEAGIESHWCACTSWDTIPSYHPMYSRAAAALVSYINQQIDPFKSLCEPRTLVSISWVMKQKLNEDLTKEKNGYFGIFGRKYEAPAETYQAKIIVNPASSDFEGTMTYVKAEDKFFLDLRHISRTNRYNDEPDCIIRTHPYLRNFCYCREQVTNQGDGINIPLNQPT